MGPQTDTAPPAAKSARLQNSDDVASATLVVDNALQTLGGGESVDKANAPAASSTNASSVPRIDTTQFHQNYDTYIFDADGVLWHGSDVFDGAAQLIAQLMDAGKRVLILTNNSTRSSFDFAEKCVKNGIKVKPENIVGAADVTAHELAKIRAARPEICELPIYLMGSAELAKFLEAQIGVKCIGPGPDHVDQYTQETILSNIDVSQRVWAVVTSFDSHLSYPKVMKAVNYLTNPDVMFIATNEDTSFPGSVPGVIVPGAGTVSSVIRAISGREPIVMGKPSCTPFNYIREKYGDVDASRTVMIGDRCDTDVLFGNRNGLHTILVLSGIHSLRDAEKFRAAGNVLHVPQAYAENVKELLF